MTPKSCPECGTAYPPHMDDRVLPPELDCPACHNEPQIADGIVANRIRALTSKEGT